MTSHFEIYEDASGKWRWRLITPNGRIIGASSQGYIDKRDAKSNVRQLCAELAKQIANGEVGSA